MNELNLSARAFIDIEKNIWMYLNNMKMMDRVLS